MREIAEKTGLSPATINYYYRAGLLPSREMPTKNSAIYTDEHVARLLLIRRLRTEGGGLPLVAIRRILELVEHGVDASVALELHRGVVGGALSSTEWSSGDQARDEKELAKKSQTSIEFVKRLTAMGVIVGAPDTDPIFDHVDVHVCRILHRVLGQHHVPAAELESIAKNIFAVVDTEMAIRNRATKDLEPQDAAKRTSELTEVANYWHAYLFMRARQIGIARYGLGSDATKPGTPIGTTSDSDSERRKQDE